MLQRTMVNLYICNNSNQVGGPDSYRDGRRAIKLGVTV